ncbi:MAG: sugar ABC transporter substrate-binding protein, partial [Planctomycetes bacterium]|nr:sugar ABC transporter substrate-binding protein [Planctomycetota bacterium]
MLRRSYLVCLLALVAGFVSSCGGDGDGKDAGARPRVAFVTNCAVEFWAVAEAGVRAAAKEVDVDALVRMPPTGTPEEQ